MGLKDKELARLDSIMATAKAQAEQREYARRQRPVIRLWEPGAVGLKLRGQVGGEISASFEFKLNDTGTGRLELPFEHHLAQWAVAWWERGKRNIVVTVDKDGARWSGMMEQVTTRQDEDGVRTVEIDFLHDYEQLKHILVWPNPFTPAAVQFPKSFMLIGPAAWVLKTSLLLNVLRHSANLWALPDDPLDFESWTSAMMWRTWPIVVVPRPMVLDETPIRYVHSRFRTWHDMAAPILEDTRMMVTVRRWFVGDPQPWPGARLRTNGQIVVDIVDKSGWWDQTATSGTILHGLARTGLEVADNLVDEVRLLLDRPKDADEYAVSGFLGVAPQQPWVVYRTDGAVNTVTSTEYVHKPATVGQVVVGGKSAPGVNELMSANVKLVFNILGSFILQPSLGSVVDTFLNPIYSDVLLAFQSIKSVVRTRHLGWGHYLENFAQGGDTAYTLSSLLALRKGFRETDEQLTHTISVADGAPYLVGDQGQGHFFLGDRIGVQVPGARDGRVDVAPVSALRLSWGVDDPHEWEITVGTWPRRDPVEWAISQIRELSAGLQDLGVI